MRRNSQGDQGITFIKDTDQEVHVSYAALYSRALRLLGTLQRLGMRKGDELIFQIEDNEKFVSLFWASVLGGIIPVPVSVGNNAEHRLKVLKIWQIMNRPRMAITARDLSRLRTFAVTNGYEALMEQIEQSALVVDELTGSDTPGEPCSSEPDDIAFLQFSSGSTGDPKGVTLTHRNLLANADGIARAGKLEPHDVFLNWMPLTHDMGLIGYHLVPVSLNANHCIMPTTLYIRWPVLWLKTAHEKRATALCSPNFGYKLFLSHFKPEFAKDWDLSHVKVIFNGAEPISAALCEEFLAALEPFGLKRNAMYTVYGLAEASVGVAFPPAREEYVSLCVARESLVVGKPVRELADASQRNALVFVEEGYAIPHCSLRICDEHNVPLGDMHVGRIQIQGLNVTQGYYNNPEDTAKVMTPDGWLDTGDLGFLRNGRLVVTGRAKEIVIIDGQNYYPHDIERAVEPVTDLQFGRVVACGVPSEDGTKEEIVVFVLHRHSLAEFVPLALSVRQAVGSRMGLPVKLVVPVREIPRTTSGKIQRFKLVEQFQSGRFAAVIEELNSVMREHLAGEGVGRLSDTERNLLAICREIFGVADIGVHDNLGDYGATSLILTEIQLKIDALYPGRVTLSNIFAYPTVAKLAHFIEHGGHISLPPAPLPETYFVRGQGGKGTAVMQFTLEGSRYQQLLHVATAEGHDPNVILLSVYIYLLSEIAESPQTAVQALIGPEHDQVVSVALDLAELESFTDLFQKVAACCGRQAGAQAYSAQDLGKIRLDRTPGSVLPLFCHKPFLAAQARIMDVFDVLLEVEHGQAKAICTCEFQTARLHKDQMEHLLGQYVQLLDDLFIHYKG